MTLPNEMEPAEQTTKEKLKSWWGSWGFIVYYLGVYGVSLVILNVVFSSTSSAAGTTINLIIILTMYPLFVRGTMNNWLKRPWTFMQWTVFALVLTAALHFALEWIF